MPPLIAYTMHSVRSCVTEESHHHLALEKGLCHRELHPRMAKPSLPIWSGVHHTRASNKLTQAHKR